MPQVKFTGYGFGEATFVFKQMVRDSTNTKPAMSKVATYMMRTIDDQFKTEGGRTGARWTPLSPKYAQWKFFQPGAKDGILQLRGPLRRSLTKRGAPGQRLEITKTEVLLESTIRYAATHQHGRGKIPARPMVELIQEDLENIEQIVEDHLLRAWKKGGGAGGTIRR